MSGLPLNLFESLAVFDLELLAHFLLQTPRFFRTFLDFSGFGLLRLACGTAVKSVRKSISVCVGVKEVHCSKLRTKAPFK